MRPPPDPPLRPADDAARFAANVRDRPGRPRPRGLGRGPARHRRSARRRPPRAARSASSSSACSGPCSRSRRRWRSPSCSAGGSADDPGVIGRGLRRRRRHRRSSRSSSSRRTTRSSRLACRIDKAWANIDVALKQRFDQLPNLVEAVRGVMTFERDVLTEVDRGPGRLLARPQPIPDQAATSDATSAAVRVPVRHGRALPGGQVRRQRDGAPGGDRAARGDDRRPAGALQRPGLPLQRADRARSRRSSWRSLFGWKSRPFFEASAADRVRPEASLESGT